MVVQLKRCIMGLIDLVKWFRRDWSQSFNRKVS